MKRPDLFSTADRIHDLIDRGAIFYCSHSGGKDSQAMYLVLRDLVPANQLVVVHAHLGKIEWPGVVGHIKANIDQDLFVVAAKKGFFDMVRSRQKFPSSAYRQCTSDLKRGPIEKFIRNDLKAKGVKIGVNCMGLRAAESRARAKKAAWKENARLSVAGREVYDWLPIHDWSTDQVFDFIYAGGQRPFWAYGERGEKNDRLSCVFCIMGCKSDLVHGARENPQLYREYVELEKEVGHTMFHIKGRAVPLEEHVGISVDDLIPAVNIC